MASIFGKFFGNTVSNAAGFAAGAATARTLSPGLQDLTNEAWQRHPSVPLEALLLAEGVAQGQVPYAWAKDEAERTGINGERFDHAVEIASTGPGVAQAFELWRRGEINEAGFRRAAKRAGLEQEWIDGLAKLFLHVLTPGELAAAIHRGLIPDPGLLKGEQPSGPRNVEQYPVYQLDALSEALGSGYDHDKLGVLVGLQGLPMGPHEAAQALFRGIITHGDYIAAFNESNNRNEWAQAVLEQSRQIPTARDFFENALRGYHDFSWALEQAKRHGMSEADATVIYQNQGRPMNIRQITQALSRGGQFNPEPGEITDPYMASIVEGNVKPGYYDLALSLKYTLPSPFVMRQLTASGVWSEAKAAKRLKDSGWIPEDADEAAHAWATTTSGQSTAYVDKAKTQLWSALHKAYLAGDTTDAQALDKLTTIGVPQAQRDDVLRVWKEERELDRARLSPAQLKKALGGNVTNPLTGVPWTEDEVLAELYARGWNVQDANTFIHL